MSKILLKFIGYRKDLENLIDVDFSRPEKAKSFVNLYDSILELSGKELRGTREYKTVYQISVRGTIFAYLLKNYLKDKEPEDIYKTLKKIKNQDRKTINNIINDLISDYIKVIKLIEKKFYLSNKNKSNIINKILSLGNTALIDNIAGYAITYLLADDLIKLHKKENMSLPHDDGITDLVGNLKKKTKNPILKSFLEKNYNELQLAAKVRKNSCHPKNISPKRYDTQKTKSLVEKIESLFLQ
jgi:hypothetical protein